MSDSTRIGTVVAGYRVDSLLGRGGMSVVYLAEHVRLGRKVALKVLSPALSHDERFRERFMRESQRAAELDHPNVISIYDAGEVDTAEGPGMLFLAMRYVEGCDLKELIKRDAPLSVGRTLFILEQAAAGLDVAHEHDLIHRDVKPGNILIAEPSDHVFLSDFGVVKHTSSRGLTETGLFVGTIDYAAPEQIEGRPLDARTDVYALGCVLYECLTGKRVFDREAEVAVMHAHLTEPPPRLTDEQPHLPQGLNRVIATAMAKSMDDRYATCPEVIDAARAVVLERRVTGEPLRPTPAVAFAAGAIAAETDGAEAPEAREETVKAAVPPPPPETEPAAKPEPKSTVLAQPPKDTTPPSEPPPPDKPAAVGGGGPGRPSWLIPALAALGAALLSGLAVFFLSMNDSDSDSGSAAGPITTTGQTPTETVDTRKLILDNVVETPLWKDCAVKTTAAPGAKQTAICTPPQNVGTANSPDSWEISIYPTAAALKEAYDAQVKLAGELSGVEKNSGRCDGISWGGEGPWTHNPSSTSTTRKPGGRYVCYFDGTDVVIAWTHEKFGQPTHIDTLAIARKGNSNHPDLFQWWRFWHHRAIGKLT